MFHHEKMLFFLLCNNLCFDQACSANDLVFLVIYQTGETGSHWDIQTPRTELKIRLAAEYFDEIRGV